MLSYYNQGADPVLAEKIELADKLNERWWTKEYKTNTEKEYGYSA